MLKKITAVLSAPFRAGREFVDTRPSLGDVRSYFTQATPQVVFENGVHSVVLDRHGVTVDASLFSTSEDTIADAQAYVNGVAKGYALATERLLAVRRSTIARQNKIVRTIDAEARAAQQAAAAPVDVMPAAPVAMPA